MERVLEDWRNCENCYFRDLKSLHGERLHHVCTNENSWDFRESKLWESECTPCEFHITWDEINNLDYSLIYCEDCPHRSWSAGCGWFCKKKQYLARDGKPHGFCFFFPLHTLIDKIPA